MQRRPKLIKHSHRYVKRLMKLRNVSWKNYQMLMFKIEAYQTELMTKWKSLKEQYLLFRQTIVNRDYLNILRNYETYREYLERMMKEWVELKAPKLIEINIEGLDQCQAVILQSIEKVRIVQQEP